jgi:hypothetical protein
MANNAEMRDGSGMFLSAASMDTSDGTLHLGEIHHTHELYLGGDGVQPFTGDMADRWGWLHPNREWRNLGLSPQFDTTAALASRMWKAFSGEQVDGVLGLDVETLKAVLTGTGPVDVAGQAVSADNVERLLLHDQYIGVSLDNAGQAGRSERLGRIADAALHALQNGGPLTSALAGVTGGRHFLAWSAHPDEQHDWQASGVAGTLAGNDLLVGVSNRGGNKLDQFLDVNTDLSLRVSPTGTDVTVRVRLANHTPSGEPDYVIATFPGSGVRPGDYLGLVTASVPAVASGLGVEGASQVNAYGPDGPTQVVALQQAVPRGTSTTVVVHFHLPGIHGSLHVVASARVPAAGWSTRGMPDWRDDQGHLVSW